jgi:hypothetical protein
MCDILQLQSVVQMGIALPVAYLALPRFRVRERISSEYKKINSALRNLGILEKFKDDTRVKSIARIGRSRSTPDEWSNHRLGRIYNSYYRTERERYAMLLLLGFSLIWLLAASFAWQINVCPPRDSWLGWIAFIIASLTVVIPSAIGLVGRACFNDAVKSMNRERSVLLLMDNSVEEQRRIGLDRAVESTENLRGKEFRPVAERAHHERPSPGENRAGQTS